MIKLDATRISVIVKCSECPWWAAFADSKAEGWSIGTRHQASVHGDSRQARDADAATRRRSS